mmetsp:Transcript_147853/g.411757  ORF Transcript_147853/g.411757 Transcript_147853/m.411757 type:complete len:294 (-) Transcript_147853:1089-1970(-)
MLVQHHDPLDARRAPVEVVVEEEVGHVPLVVPAESVHALGDVAPAVGVGARALRHHDLQVRVLLMQGLVGRRHAPAVAVEGRAGKDARRLPDGLLGILGVVPVVVVGEQLWHIPKLVLDPPPEPRVVARGEVHARVVRREERFVLQRQVLQRQTPLFERLLDLQEVVRIGLVGRVVVLEGVLVAPALELPQLLQPSRRCPRAAHQDQILVDGLGVLQGRHDVLGLRVEPEVGERPVVPRIIVRGLCAGVVRAPDGDAHHGDARCAVSHAEEALHHLVVDGRVPRLQALKNTCR